MAEERTYSDKIKGDANNYEWEARFDITQDGYLGITQWTDDRLERVLLSLQQVKELRKFTEPKRKARKAKAA